jgi:hypothetical protein
MFPAASRGSVSSVLIRFGSSISSRPAEPDFLGFVSDSGMPVRSLRSATTAAEDELDNHELRILGSQHKCIFHMFKKYLEVA